MTDVPALPDALGAHGLALWRELSEGYLFSEADLVLLESTCRTVDLLDRLESELRDTPLTVPAPGGTIRAHPLLAEVAKHKGILARLVRQLGVPDATDADDEPSNNSDRARRAARVRWGVR